VLGNFKLIKLYLLFQFDIQHNFVERESLIVIKFLNKFNFMYHVNRSFPNMNSVGAAKWDHSNWDHLVNVIKLTQIEQVL